MKCPNCQNENPAEANFCNNCATPLGGADHGNKFSLISDYIPPELKERILQAGKQIESERKFVENIFGAPFFDQYASVELEAMSWQCEEKSGYHIDADSVVMQFVDEEGQEVAPGETGEIVCTSLFNYSMPFIRYEIGDTAVLGKTNCNCGNILPTLKKITGRIIDHFIKENGEMVNSVFFVYLFDVYYNKGNIKKFQIVQEDFDKIRIIIVPSGKISDSDKIDIEKRIKNLHPYYLPEIIALPIINGSVEYLKWMDENVTT